MRGISVDLRERIIERYEQGYNAQEVAQHYQVSTSSVYRYVRLAREGKSLEADQPPGRPSILHKAGLEPVIRELVQDYPQASLQEYISRLEQQTNVKLSIASMCRVLQKLDLPRKKRRSTL